MTDTKPRLIDLYSNNYYEDAKTRKKRKTRILKLIKRSAIILTVTALFAPVIINNHVRFVYGQTLAHWKSKILPPKVVVIGDSIALGGGWFNNDTINLGSNGLQTFQITAMMGKAISYNPRYIVVMAGTNDAIKGSINSQEIQESWNRICSDHRVIVTLTPPTSDFNLNLRLNEINSMIKKSCDKRPLVTLDALRDSNGLIDPKFTFDGVHLNHEGYRVWINELQKHNI